MKPGTPFVVEVNPRIPRRLSRLTELADNLWYGWDRPSRTLFARLHPGLWDAVNHNPKAFLKRVDEERLTEAAEDHIFLGNYNRVLSAFDTYMSEPLRRDMQLDLHPGDLIAIRLPLRAVKPTTARRSGPLLFLLPALAMALSSGVFEELLFRGALFRIVEEWLGSWIALVVSSLVFGLTHLMNPQGTLEGALFIAVEAGVLLGAAVMLTRRLWLSIGFHMAWNYTQQAIFASIVSGNDAAPGLIRSTIKGPDYLTGGSFGVESSVLALVLCTTTGIVMLVMAHRRGLVVPPIWKRTG
jgi:membrane protease YdiL (CAAX protease family)